MYMEIGLLILGIALLLLVFFSIPILWKVWRAVNDATVTLDALNQHLPGILKNLEDISANINNSTTALNDEIQKYTATADRLHAVMDKVVRGAEYFSPIAVQSPLFRKITEAIALAKGIRVFLSVFLGQPKM